MQLEFFRSRFSCKVPSSDLKMISRRLFGFLQCDVAEVYCCRFAHGNNSYRARRTRKPKPRYLYGAVPPVHHIRRRDHLRQRYTDKYGVRSDKFVPIQKLPAPRWNWDYDVTEENTKFLKKVAVESNSDLESRILNPFDDEEWEMQPWTRGSLRCGAIGVKLGVHPVWFKDGTYCNATLLQIVDCNVIKYFSKEEFNGRSAAMIVGAKNASPFYKNEKYAEFFHEAGVPMKTKCFRFTVSENAALKPGTPLNAMHFRVGQYVDCTAKTVGYGFQGVMQKYKMGGGPPGAKLWHRRIGSIGSGRERGVTKGRTMPGQMGGTNETIRGLKVIRMNTRYNVMYIKGRIPGHINQFIKIFDSTVRKYKPTNPTNAERLIGPFPCYKPSEDTIPEEIYDESVHALNQPSVTHEADKP